jgi:hypothetical protein
VDNLNSNGINAEKVCISLKLLVANYCSKNYVKGHTPSYCTVL